MKVNIFRIIIIILFITGCASAQRKDVYQPRILDHPDATYENDVLPFIIEQLNDTAATFFYDIKKYNKILRKQRRPPRTEPVLNVIVGEKETGGVCQDYSSHFIDNYKGLGEIYYVRVDYNGEAELLRRVKPFERSDIIIKNPNKLIIRDAGEINHRFYSSVFGAHRRYSRKGWAWGWNYSMRGGWSDQSGEWHIGPYTFYSSKDRGLYLVEEIPIPTPLSHAGETDINMFSNHAWVRIIWRDMTIDIDPTWYDNGRPLEFGVIEEIIPNRINTFPIAYSNYRQLSNTKLISPLSGTLESGNSYTFIVSSNDFSTFAIIINNEWKYFTKNDETENFELNLTIPDNIDTIKISAVTITGNSRSAVGIIGYNIEKQ